MRPNPNATTLFSFPTARLSGLQGMLCLALAFAAPASAQAVDSSLSFFITGTSLETGGNFGGLSGADAHCQSLAASVGAGNRVWRAYLSTQPVGATPGVNARDRIGTGPWFNANKVKIASDVAELHGTNNLTATTNITQTGAAVPSNKHDIVTGTRADGSAPAAGADTTCSNWTSNASGLPARTMVGHHNRQGISSNIIPTSWNQAHVTTGCTQANLEQGGGDGLFYCFAADNGTVGLRVRQMESIGPSLDRAPYLLPDGARGNEVVYRFELKAPARVEVSVHDLDGRRRVVLAKGLHRAGKHAVRWDGASSSGLPMPAGLYVIALKREAQPGN